MKRLRQTWILGGLLVCGIGMGLPDVSYAVTGCSNANLQGTYVSELASADLLNVLNSINTTATSGGSPSSVNNPFSANGVTIAPVQLYLDGQGNIVALNPNGGGATSTTPTGTYSVNTDCSASISLTNGATFLAVLVSGGSEVLFIQTNAGQGGAIGTLQRSSNVCLASFPQPSSFGFSFSGTQQTTTSGKSTNFSPVSGIGELQLNGQGGFSMQEWVYEGTIVVPATLTGTYTVGSNCTLSLTFATGGTSSAAGVTSAILAPVSFTGGLLNGSTGLLTVQPNATSTVTGAFVSQ